MSGGHWPRISPGLKLPTLSLLYSAQQSDKPSRWSSPPVRTDGSLLPYVAEEIISNFIFSLRTASVPEGQQQDRIALSHQTKLEMKRVISKSAPYVAILKNGAYKSLCNRNALLAEIGQAIS